MARPQITVVGLGPAGPELLTAQAVDALDRAAPHRRFVRTAKHPAAAAIEATSFDHVYETADAIDDVYPAIVAALVAAAEDGPVVYAVPGSPLVAERTVELLRAEDVDLTVLPCLSFLDLAWDRLGIDPLAAGVRLVDGHRFAVEAAGERGPLLVAQCDSPFVLSDIKLACEPPPGTQVTVLQRLGLPSERVLTVSWEDLDRASAFTPDHLTSVWIPVLAAPVGAELVRFVELTRTLRERCPWDQEQTHESLVRYLIEESYELVEAIEGAGDGPDPEHLEEELGDVLYQVFFHAALAAEEGWFTIADVARTVHDKLVHRHPHVFGDVDADDSGTVACNWEAIKRAEKGRESALDGIPMGLPALALAAKVGKKAAGAGFDWPAVEGALAKIPEEAAELVAEPSEDELGDLLFSVVNVARHLGLDPESALRGATRKFAARFRAVEVLAAERGVALAPGNIAALDALWDEVKGTAPGGGASETP